MSETRSHVRFATEDGSIVCWPNPHDPNEIEWKLRYAPDSRTRADMMVAASVMDAYRNIINLDSRTRQLRVMQLRKASKPSEESL